MKLTTGEVSRLTQAKLVGPEDFVISEVGDPRDSKSSTLCFVNSDKYLNQVESSAARAWILSSKHFALLTDSAKNERIFLLHDEPQMAYIKIIEKFYPAPQAQPLRHPQAWIHPTAEVHPSCQIEAFVSVGAGCQVGEGTILHGGVWLGEGARIGAQTILYAGVKVYPQCQVGNRVIIHAGAVIGADGFGFIGTAKGIVKVPQVGRVVIHDDVEIGANTCIDRGALGDTVIGSGTKIDNFCQIAHNCVVGKNCILCGFVGLSGNTIVGNNVVFGAQAGTKGHLTIGDGCQIAGQTGVTKDLPPGSVVKGYPPQPVNEYLKNQTLWLKLPEFYKRLKSLEHLVEKGDDSK